MVTRVNDDLSVLVDVPVRRVECMLQRGKRAKVDWDGYTSLPGPL